MPSLNKIKRERLFKIYSQNLSIYFPNVKDQFLCPICHQLFSRDDLDSLLTIAHIIPKSVDGKLVTLTCKECNNKIGSKYDKNIAKEKIFNDFNHGKGSLPARLKTDIGDIGVDISKNNAGFLIKHRPKQSNLKVSSDIVKSFCKDWNGSKFNVTVKAFKPENRNISLFHSALLMMFYYFGYEYLLSENIKCILDLINDSKLWNKSYHNIIGTLNNTSNNEYLENKVNIIVKPFEARSFFIVIPSVDCSTLANIIILPGFGKDGEKPYNDILSGKVKISGLNLGLKSIPYDEASLTKYDLKFYSHKMWKDIFKVN